ncbi:DUF3072 domain-containing protein [Methylobacterium sp. Leaf466]|uniref:DUF3072 domain-containing protein n=1 Tax=Methylobacterium sp. Leaf466 TaxID=1736386 RepID=UPI0006FF426D|nr:DUF3072 domain-containing protein [Methylobacterium sp. Leaf466]KQT80755.1 hypothetical protein ASG59_04860 [Methylobacterium sp. Leaf466]
MTKSKPSAQQDDARQADSERADPKQSNPKTEGGDASNRIKDPDQWTTGSEPMTGAQASYLKTLTEEVGEPAAFEPDLDKAEASKRIDALRQEAGRG